MGSKPDGVVSLGGGGQVTDGHGWRCRSRGTRAGYRWPLTEMGVGNLPLQNLCPHVDRDDLPGDHGYCADYGGCRQDSSRADVHGCMRSFDYARDDRDGSPFLQIAVGAANDLPIISEAIHALHVRCFVALGVTEEEGPRSEAERGPERLQRALALGGG